MKQTADVLNELPHFTLWRKLGRYLGIDEGKLEVIKEDCRKSSECLEEVIKYWLKGNHDQYEYGPPTWGSLAKAVKPIDIALALKIKGKHGKNCTLSQLYAL